jgi:hypothetical protein
MVFNWHFHGSLLCATCAWEEPGASDAPGRAEQAWRRERVTLYNRLNPCLENAIQLFICFSLGA